jgi:hypothetical protein
MSVNISAVPLDAQNSLAVNYMGMIQRIRLPSAFQAWAIKTGRKRREKGGKYERSISCHSSVVAAGARVPED